MTCFIASEDPILREQLNALCLLAGVAVTTEEADLLLLDIDMPMQAPECEKTLCFSKNKQVAADFYRPFSYVAFLDEMAFRAKDLEDEKQTLAYSFPKEAVFTATEKRLLDELLKANGKTVSFGQLALSVFGSADNLNELKVYIRHLRQKAAWYRGKTETNQLVPTSEDHHVLTRSRRLNFEKAIHRETRCML